MQVTAVKEKRFISGMLNTASTFSKYCTCDKYITALNSDTNSNEKNISYVSIFDLKHKERWSLNVKEAYKLDAFANIDDVYCSVNSLYCPGRHTSKYIKKLNAIFLDLDYYNIPELQGLSAEQVIGLMESELDYPIPSFYIDSGRGLYVVWILNSTYATLGSKKFWKKLEKDMIEYFKDFGADPKCADVARVLRVIGSKNSKNNSTVKILGSPNFEEVSDFKKFKKYEMRDFAEFLWGTATKDIFVSAEQKTKKKRKQTNKVIQIKNTYTLNYYRYKDLEMIVELRQGTEMAGCREKLLFLYRLNMLYCRMDPAAALQKTLALNSQFKDPLGEDEVIDATANAEGIGQVYLRLSDNYKDEWDISLNQHLYNGGAYIYKNSTIIKELGITEEEQRHLKTIIGPTIKKERKDLQNKEYYIENKKEISKKYKQKIKENGKLTRDQKNNQIRKQIKELLDKGKTQTEIANILSLNRKTIQRHIKNIKENNL